MNRRTFTLRTLAAGAAAALSPPLEAIARLISRAGNPIFPGWYADPEARVFPDADGKATYWIYPTYSAVYDQQLFLDAFSSTDLVTWTKHPRVFDAANVMWRSEEHTSELQSL